MGYEQVLNLPAQIFSFTHNIETAGGKRCMKHFCKFILLLFIEINCDIPAGYEIQTFGHGNPAHQVMRTKPDKFF
jgi:hypothetical protein